MEEEEVQQRGEKPGEEGERAEEGVEKEVEQDNSPIPAPLHPQEETQEPPPPSDDNTTTAMLVTDELGGEGGQQPEVVIERGENGQETYYVVVEGGAEGGNLVQLVEMEGEEGSNQVLLSEEQLIALTGAGGSMGVVDGGRIESQQKIIRTGPQEILAQNEDGTYSMLQLVEEDGIGVGATATATDGGDEEIQMVEPMPQGMKMRRNRVFGSCRCPECGQTFVNTARLERHLAVHQVFGSYLCPLCGKTYKYEYNLFYHWRRTCRDLNELMNIDDRKAMDVNALRQLVDEVAAKKAELGTLEPPFRPPPSIPEHPPPRMDIPHGRRGEACPECGVVVLASHLDRHMAIHRGELPVDTRGVSGGFYCDLCGLMFRQHFNLMKHWRTSCPEIQMQINPDMDLTMDDDTLKHLVEELLQKKRVDEAEMPLSSLPNPPHTQRIVDVEPQQSLHQECGSREMGGLRQERKKKQTDGEAVEIHIEETVVQHEQDEQQQDEDFGGETGMEERRVVVETEEPVDKIVVEEIPQRQPRSARVRSRKTGDGEEEDTIDAEVDVTTVEERAAMERNQIAAEEIIETDTGQVEPGEWMDEAEFEDDDGQFEDEPMGRLPPMDEADMMGPLGFPSHVGGRAKWSMAGGPVQCPECFRSFANAGRLERHLAGFHASYGTHHCSLCGNRFKYDYNLLYHYRHSCPYTKAFIDRDVREQMDAPSLRKLVRNLAQKEVRLTPHVEPPPKLAGREQPKPRLAMRYPSNQPPAHLLMPRPGLPEGKTCPVCGIIFYGVGAIQRHMQAAHPAEWEEWLAEGGPDNNLTIQHRQEPTNYFQEEEMVEGEMVVEDDDGVVVEEYHAHEPSSPLPPPPKLLKSVASPSKHGRLRKVPGQNKQEPDADIDPGLESSIATFLTEMRHEATHQQQEEDENAPSSSSQQRMITRRAKTTPGEVASVKRITRKNAKRFQGEEEETGAVKTVSLFEEGEEGHYESSPVLSADFEEDLLDVGDYIEGGAEHEMGAPKTRTTRGKTATKLAPDSISPTVHTDEPASVQTTTVSSPTDKPPPKKRGRMSAPETNESVEGQQEREEERGEGSAAATSASVTSAPKSPRKRERVVVEDPVCKECGKKFYSKAHLMQHIKRSHSANESSEPMDCVLCQLQFREKYSLITHLQNSCPILKNAVKDRAILNGLDPDELIQLAVEIGSGAEVVEEPPPPPPPRRGRRSNRSMVEYDVD